MGNDQFGPAAETGLIIFLLGSMFLIAIAMFAFWLWMLIDCISNEQSGSSQQVVWSVLIVIFGLFGAFAYNISRRKQRIRELGH